LEHLYRVTEDPQLQKGSTLYLGDSFAPISGACALLKAPESGLSAG
jgi:hypothetical protein